MEMVPRSPVLAIAVRPLAIVLALCVGILAVPGRSCGSPQSYIIKPRMLGNHVVGELRIGAGVACYRDGTIGPPSYLVADVGKMNVPKLSAADVATLRKRFSDTAPTTLRFLSLPLAEPHLVVFNASLSELCNPISPPFKDLNGSCNQYYSPLEGMDRTTAAPGC